MTASPPAGVAAGRPWPLQAVVAVGEPAALAATVAAFALAASVAVALVALGYRWYFRAPLPQGIGLLFGTAVIALYLNTVTLGEVVTGTGGGLFRIQTALFQLFALAVAALASPLGRAIGDRVGTDLFAFSGAREIEGGVSRVVQSVGRVTSVTLPEEPADIPEYDPVPPATKAEIAGKTLLFPRRLTVAELRDRLVTRLKEDYGVGHVDVDLDADGTVAHLGVGSRAAGLGPTLAPGSAAVAVRADPANSASPGDVVQVWTPPPEPSLHLTAELRATAGDVTTLAVDEPEVDRLDGATRYRLVTLPAERRADREFASLLRAADETMAAVTVAEGSDLAGTAVDDIGASVVALRPAGGAVEAIPAGSRRLAAGDVVYALARPEALRRLETRAGPASAGTAGADAA